jgi:hypothetical protein
MKKLFILFICVCFSSCLFESQNDLNVTIINSSKVKVYVGESYYGCDSCGIMKDVRLYCSHGNDTTFFPRLLNMNDSTVMRTKMHGIQKIDVINADSLAEYCKKGMNYNITNKSWVRVITKNVDLKNKTCTIAIQ